MERLRGSLGPRWSLADRQVIYNGPVHTSLGSYGLTSSNREICQPLGENKAMCGAYVSQCVWRGLTGYQMGRHKPEQTNSNIIPGPP